MGGRRIKWGQGWHGIAALATLIGIAISWWQFDRSTMVVPRLRATDPLPLVTRPPRVAVVIPARNEAAHVAACLATLTTQRLPPLAIWVVDDHSTDATATQLRQLAREVPTIHPLAAPERPPGWAGKNWALHVGITAALKHSNPEWLLLTDADTWHHPDLLWRAVALTSEMHVDALTAIPGVVNEGRGAILVRAAIGEYLSLLLGADYPARTRDPRLPEAMAAGQFILVRADAARDGMDQDELRDALDDDRAFLMTLKAHGHRVGLAYAQEMLTTEGYATAAAAWKGHAHHLAASLGKRVSAPRAVGALMATFATLSLPFIAFAGVLTGGRKRVWRNRWPALAHWGSHAALVSLMRRRAARLTHLPEWYVLASPVSALLVQGLLVRLTIQRLTGRLNITWKGRRYR